MNIDKYKKCSNLLFEIYPSATITNYTEKYKLDPFFKLGKNSNGRLIDLNAWYKEKNPNFMPFSEQNNPEMPEFKHLIAGMIKDLYFFFSKGKKPNENINTILDKIEFTLKNNYKYISIIDIIYDYLILFQGGQNLYDCDSFNKIIKTPYIIYPTFHQIDFIKVNLTIGTPFLNFLLTNKIHNSHGHSKFPCWEVKHDIDIHYDKIMIRFFKELNEIINNNDNYILFINNNIELFKLFFEFMNNFITSIKDLLMYDRSKKSISITSDKGNISTNEINISNNRHDSYKIYMNSILIFHLFHEKYFFKDIFHERYLNRNYFFNKIINNKNKKYQIDKGQMTRLIEKMLNKYFYKEFKSLCIYYFFDQSLIRLQNSLYKNFEDKINHIDAELIEVLKDAFKPKTINDNIDIYIELYKESVETINAKIQEIYL